MKDEFGDEMDFAEVVNKIQEQENLYGNEGRTGVKNLGKLVNLMGYCAHYDNETENLMAFLEDNPGAIEAVKDWISQQSVPEWQESLESLLYDDEEEEDVENE